MYKQDLFYLQQAWLAPVYQQIHTTKSQLSVQNINVTKTGISRRNKLHAPTVKMVHNNYNNVL